MANEYATIIQPRAAAQEQHAFMDEEVDDNDQHDDDDVRMSVSTKRQLATRIRSPWVTWFWFICTVVLAVLIGSQSRKNTVSSSCSSSSSSSSSSTSSGGETPSYRTAAVASDHKICSDLASEQILKALHGNAVDAAVTVALCLGVVNPASSGLGGGAFMLVHAKPRRHPVDRIPAFLDARTDLDSSHEAIDCRERAPSAAHENMFDDLPTNASVYGGLAISVSGELHCLEVAHARFGKLAWNQVVQPVIEMAEQGTPVGTYLSHQIPAKARAFSQTPSLDTSSLRALLTHNDNWDHPLREGDILYNPELVETLRAVAREGVAAIYGRAEQLAQEIQAVGGIVTAEDLSSYRATIRTPVTTKVQGLTFVGIPPPSSGGAAILGAVRFLASFAEPLVLLADTLSMHRLVEACKHVFAIRMSLSDPDFNSDVVSDAVQDLSSGSYMESLMQDHYRDNTTLPLSQYGGSKWSQLTDDDGTEEAVDAKEGDRKLLRSFGYLEDHGTSHFSIVDADGNAVAMTTSVNTNFGSAIRSPSMGFIFSNTMDDFAKPGPSGDYFGILPAESNYIRPGKRPLSSMSPTMVFRQDKLLLVIGASGGPKIITSVLQVVLRHLFLGQSLHDAIWNPRLHNQLVYHGASVTTLEDVTLHDKVKTMVNVSRTTRDALLRRGHSLLDVDYMGTVQAVSIDPETGTLSAASDPRKGGLPAGF